MESKTPSRVQREEDQREEVQREEALREGNTCIALGVGVGGLGTAAAVTLGATCPLCFIAAPALVGMGVYRRLTTGGRSQPASEDSTRDRSQS